VLAVRASVERRGVMRMVDCWDWGKRVVKLGSVQIDLSLVDGG
jgi:hypothetical protein